MLQNLLVTPPAMYWPATLVTVQLFTTLYSNTSTALSRAAGLATRQRLRVFMLVFLATFIYHFLPLLLFPTLTSFSVLCLLNNRSWWMRTLGSGYTGLGVGNLSFDWSSIGSSGPLYTPFWALGNYFGGLVGMCWIVSTTRQYSYRLDRCRSCQFSCFSISGERVSVYRKWLIGTGMHGSSLRQLRPVFSIPHTKSA